LGERDHKVSESSPTRKQINNVAPKQKHRKAAATSAVTTSAAATDYPMMTA